MKFIIRDDDVSYHFQPKQLKEWYSGIVDICPISVCIPPFIKGNFFEGVYRAEHGITRTLEERKADDIYKLGDNKELTDYLKSLLKQNLVSIGLHGIHHRNEEDFSQIPVKGNFITGAEFYTQNDYTNDLREAKTYLEELFGIPINYFSAPQNLITSKGMVALVNNNLSLCTDLTYTRNIKDLLHFYGLWNVAIMAYYRKVKHHSYPFVIKHNGIKYITHTRLQPGNNIEKIKREFDFVHSLDGVFVLSTHCYGFDYKMEHYEMTMKEALMDILHYTKQFDNIEYTTLHDLFK